MNITAREAKYKLNFTGLEYLSISDTEINTIQPLMDLPNLENLSCRNTFGHRPA